MKNKFLFLTLIVAIASAGCGKDEKGTPVSGIEGEKSIVSLLIYDATISSKTRAADTETDAPDPDESSIDVSKGIKVVVFNEDGSLAYPLGTDPIQLTLTETSSGSGRYKSTDFTLNAGQKYFYVFANDDGNLVSKPGETMTRNQFITQTIATTLDPVTHDLNITAPNFLMGTLWSKKELAPGGGSAGNPETVPLSIGRLSSKVTLLNVEKGQSNMSGTFADPKYRLGTIPKKIYLVGNNDESTVTPPWAGHGVVISAVHDAPEMSNGSDANFQDYTEWYSPATAFYTSENTTAPVQGIQYYGNTTYIQIVTIYTPADAEVYDPTALDPISGSFTGPTFYTARIASGETLIFEDDPRTAAGNNPHEDIDQNSVMEYTDGRNYHKFAVYDPEAGLADIQKNTVLRNHSYRYKVTNITELGTNDPNVDPDEPVESPTTLVVEVDVLEWSKIEDEDVTI